MVTSVIFRLNQLDVQPGQRVLLRNVTWDEFEQILSESGEHRATRLAYYQGTLEILVPLPEHENTNRFIETLINALVEELDLEIKKLGFTTFRRANVESGAEPDSCYYIQNEPVVKSRKHIDLEAAPPPDIVLEIDVRHNLVELQFTPESVCLRVQDDGCGFDPTRHTDSGGFGLVGMRQRCDRIAGQLTIRSQPGQGTAIVAFVPLGQD